MVAFFPDTKQYAQAESQPIFERRDFSDIQPAREQSLADGMYQLADGAVMNYCVPPEYNDRALELLEKGAKKAGSTLANIDRPQLIVCSVDQDHDKAIEYTKELLCQYLAQQPHIAKASGVSQEVINEIQSTLGWPATKEQINKVKHLVPDELVNKITASGTPEEARAKVAEYIKRGCTCPILYPVGGNFKLLIDTFAQK
jgi:5,10-methylenetetrahydromethanopterin reductase